MTFYICEKCGGMKWVEKRTTHKTFVINRETLTSEIIDESDFVFHNETIYCLECNDEESLIGFEEKELGKKEMKKLIEMNNTKRVEWVISYKVIEEL